MLINNNITDSGLTSVRDNVRQSSSPEFSPTSDDVDAAKTSTSTFGEKTKPRSKSATSMSSDSGAVEVQKPETEVNPASVRPSQDGAKSSTSSVADCVNPAAAALASLQPARLRTNSKPVQPPKLTLHEQLMIAIREAGGAVPTTATSHPSPGRPRSVGASSSGETFSTVLSVSRSSSHEPTSSNAAATDRLSPGKPSTSPAVVTAKRSPRVIEPPKPTPHEQLMTAIRTAGGLTQRRSADPGNTAASSPSSNSTVDASAKDLPSSSPHVSRDDRSAYLNGSAPTSPIPPPPPTPAPPSFSTTLTVVPEGPKATTSQTLESAFRSRTTPQPQPVDTREELLAAIRGAAGGKGLRKVTTTDFVFE